MGNTTISTTPGSPAPKAYIGRYFPSSIIIDEFDIITIHIEITAAAYHDMSVKEITETIQTMLVEHGVVHLSYTLCNMLRMNKSNPHEFNSPYIGTVAFRKHVTTPY